RLGGAGAGVPGEPRDDFRELLALVLLEEVTAAGDRRVVLPFRAGGARAHRLVGAARDRVRIAERREERLLPPLEDLPRLPVGRRGRVVGRRGDENRELPRAGLERVVGERRVV